MRFVVTWLLACWLGRFGDFLLACFWLACWLVGLLIWLAGVLASGHYSGLLCWIVGIFLFFLLAGLLKELNGLLILTGVLAC